MYQLHVHWAEMQLILYVQVGSMTQHWLSMNSFVMFITKKINS